MLQVGSARARLCLCLGQVWRAWQTLAPRAKQLYLYSDADALIPPSEVRRCMALQARALARRILVFSYCRSFALVVCAPLCPAILPQAASLSSNVKLPQLPRWPCRKRGAWTSLPGCSGARRTSRTSGSIRASMRRSWTASCMSRSRRRPPPDAGTPDCGQTLDRSPPQTWQSWASTFLHTFNLPPLCLHYDSRKLAATACSLENRARVPMSLLSLLPVMVALAAAEEERGRLVGRARLHLVVVRLAVAALGALRCAAAHRAAVRAQGRCQGLHDCLPVPATKPACMHLKQPAWQAHAACQGCRAGLDSNRASKPSARAARKCAHWATAQRSSRPPPRPARPPRASSSAWQPCSSARPRLPCFRHRAVHSPVPVAGHSSPASQKAAPNSRSQDRRATGCSAPCGRRCTGRGSTRTCSSAGRGARHSLREYRKN